MLGLCWPTVYDVGPTSTQHWFKVSCFLGSLWWPCICRAAVCGLKLHKFHRHSIFSLAPLRGLKNHCLRTEKKKSGSPTKFPSDAYPPPPFLCSESALVFLKNHINDRRKYAHTVVWQVTRALLIILSIDDLPRCDLLLRRVDLCWYLFAITQKCVQPDPTSSTLD